MSESPLAFALSDDKATLTIQLREGALELKSGDVLGLIRVLASQRHCMTPSIPDTVIGSNTDFFDCDRYDVIQNRNTGEVQIYLRIPGISWSCIHLAKDQAMRMSETLNPPSGSPGGASLN